MDMNKPMPVYISTLGCPKNEVDSQVITNGLIDAGFVLVDEPQAARLIIINTCAFIKEAKEESIAAILEAGEYKKNGSCRWLVVVGCFVQRYGKDLKALLPEVDLFLGVNAIGEIAKHLAMLFSPVKAPSHKITKPTFLMNSSQRRLLETPCHYAYLKIADGCDNRCSYCAIPQIRGRYRSRGLTDVIQEAVALAEQGVKEIIVSAQDTTFFGGGVPDNPDLVDLLMALAEIKNIRWIRLLYTHPARISERLLEAIRYEEKICNYIDMPIQHINDKVLSSMGRKITKKGIFANIENIRRIVPRAAIRTSLIVGYPLETDKRFQELLHFIEEVRFEHLGVFCYSREEETPAYALGNRVSRRMMEERRHLLMETQARIAYEINQSCIGTVVEVIVDAVTSTVSSKAKDAAGGEACYVGRTSRQAPDIDGATLVRSHGGDIRVGDLIHCFVQTATEYDLEAVPDMARKSERL